MILNTHRLQETISALRGAAQDKEELISNRCNSVRCTTLQNAAFCQQLANTTKMFFSMFK